MVRFLLVCLGGALGSGARFALSSWIGHASGASFPLGTLLVNLVGSFLLGMIMQLPQHRAPSGILDLSTDLPVVVEVVDTEEQMQRLGPILDELASGSGILVTLETVHVLRHGPGAPG
jgi:hypothetical protein